ncbi:hypothetical protein DFH06DRAFT_1325563 [Mycena polygramma]|nr:hypothetical protein DFH06DRAFT_1325563 [Mycena polygramma]
MSSSPPPYPGSRSEVDRLLADLERLDLGSSTQTVYRFQSPVKSGYTAHWDEAAEYTQGTPGGHVSAVGSRSRPRNRAKAYAVFYGRIPGVYKTWAEARQQVDGVSGSLFQGTRPQTTPTPRSPTRRHIHGCESAAHDPVALEDTPNPLHTGGGAASSGRRWYVVYCGITPGVYQSSLECGLNTSGLSCATHDSWGSRTLAIAKYQNAVKTGRVRVISPPCRWMPASDTGAYFDPHFPSSNTVFSHRVYLSNFSQTASSPLWLLRNCALLRLDYKNIEPVCFSSISTTTMFSSHLYSPPPAYFVSPQKSAELDAFSKLVDTRVQKGPFIQSTKGWFLADWGMAGPDGTHLWNLTDHHKTSVTFHPTFWAPTLHDVVQHLPCVPSSATLSTSKRTTFEQVEHIYFVVKGSSEILESVDSVYNRMAAYERPKRHHLHNPQLLRGVGSHPPLKHAAHALEFAFLVLQLYASSIATIVLRAMRCPVASSSTIMSASPSASNSSSSSPSADSSSSTSPPLTHAQLILRKQEQHRAQTRARMSRSRHPFQHLRVDCPYSSNATRYRSKLKELPPEEQEEALQRARAARARYRQRNHAELLHSARSKRHAAYAEKFGEEALQEKLQRQRQRQLEKQERPRRRDRVKPTKASKTEAPPRTHAERRDHVRTPIIHPYQYVYPCAD